MPSAGDVLTFVATGKAETYQTPAASGNITGPGSSTDRAISTWNGTGGTALFNNSTVKIDSTGRYINTTQPSFFAYTSTVQTDVTGDDTQVVQIFDTELFDIGSNYDNTTGIFTAPVGGVFRFSSAILYQTMPIGGSPSLRLHATGINYPVGNFNASLYSGNFLIAATWVVALAVSETAKIVGVVGSVSKTVDIFGGSGDPRTFFSGQLVG